MNPTDYDVPSEWQQLYECDLLGMLITGLCHRREEAPPIVSLLNERSFCFLETIALHFLYLALFAFSRFSF